MQTDHSFEHHPTVHSIDLGNGLYNHVVCVGADMLYEGKPMVDGHRYTIPYDQYHLSMVFSKIGDSYEIMINSIKSIVIQATLVFNTPARLSTMGLCTVVKMEKGFAYGTISLLCKEVQY